jgi:uncharacterized protein YeaO (DUF488 family)
LKAWKAGNISWDQYTERYLQEMSTHEKVIEDLARKAMSGTITLLCFEGETDPHCHRHLLKKLVEKRMKGQVDGTDCFLP